MPHPALIARYVDDLLTTLDTDVPKARAILMRVLPPFTLMPDCDSYGISGALNLSAVMGPGVSEKCSSGGPLPDLSHTLWFPIRIKPGEAVRLDSHPISAP